MAIQLFITVGERFWSKVNKTPTDKGCLEWTAGCDKDGYGRLSKVLYGKEKRATHVAWFLATGYWPDSSKDENVLHTCDNPPCVNKDHLWLGSTKDNTDDMVAKGRHATGDRHGSKTHPEKVLRGVNHPSRLYPRLHAGENNGNAKLTRYSVRVLRCMYRRGIGNTYTLAAIFGITNAMAGRIVNRVAWK